MDGENGNRGRPYDTALAIDPDIVVNRISGAFFFDAAANVAAALAAAKREVPDQVEVEAPAPGLA
ncbi:MAG TPA: hypothetical protein VFU97_09255 [Xanthobacteraceae bacterium]|nr:hypothetical protein [Xanthobacteraceae bacterium]